MLTADGAGKWEGGGGPAEAAGRGLIGCVRPETNCLARVCERLMAVSTHTVAWLTDMARQSLSACPPNQQGWSACVLLTWSDGLIVWSGSAGERPSAGPACIQPPTGANVASAGSAEARVTIPR